MHIVCSKWEPRAKTWLDVSEQLRPGNWVKVGCWGQEWGNPLTRPSVHVQSQHAGEVQES